MSRFFYTSLFVILCSHYCFAQLTGTKTIPGSYVSLASAVADLNTQGVGSGGVTFNIAAGYTETAPAGGILLTASGTAANPILFQKAGSGASPKVTSTDAGSITTATFGGQGDAVIIIQGSDYVTFNSIDIAASQSGIEYGYYLRKASGTNGCKSVAIRNAVITLAKGTSPYVVGIYASNNDNTSTASSAAGVTVTTTGGLNENISFTGNTITDVATGISLVGYNAASPYNLYDQGFTIGSVGAGNTIQNFGGNSTGAAYGIYLLYIKSAIVNYNTISSNTNGLSTAGAISGVYFDINQSGAGDYIVNNNSFTLSQASTAALSCIYNRYSTTTFEASNNTFSIGTFASTAESYLIYGYSTTASCTVNNNRTMGTINKTGGGRFVCYFQSGGIPTGNVAFCTGNNFSNITTIGYFDFTGILYSNIASQVFTITNNTISNITGNGASSFTGLSISYGKDNSVVSGNVINGLSGAYSIIGFAKDISVNSNPVGISGNIISNLSALDVVYGMQFNDGTHNVFKNKVYNLTASSNTGTVYGMSIRNSPVANVYNNYIGNLNTPAVNSLSDAIEGIVISGVANLYYNTVYINATTSGTNFNTSAIYHFANSNPGTGTLQMKNNILVNTSTAKGSGTTVVIRRSGSTLNNYSTASNNNLLYAGSPSASNLLYNDGLNAYSSLTDFKTFVAPRESASVTELPPFISTTGSAANYLHIAPNTATQANNGAIPISTITDDYDGQIRSTTTPDIGADEFDIALPIKFEYLTGKKAGTTNSLNWKVTCTSTSITMVLERSADARSFNQVVTSISATQARCGQPFDAVDATPINGINYYRLKMIDVDGKVSYSPIAAVLNGKAGAELVGIYPTVVKDQAYLSVTSSRNTTMQFSISDMSGKVIKTINQAISSGSSMLPVSTSNLASGVYNITGLLDGVRTQTLRFVKQ